MPDRLRGGAFALYAFCRLSDDTVDGAAPEGDALLHLQARLDRVYAGSPAPVAVERALCDTVERFEIPRVCFDALLEGFAWDTQGRCYETLDDVIAYGVRVAGSVGAMMAALMGARSPALLARACDLGVAMQLTNIARDVGDDARAGRLYLPRAWLREEGIDPEAFLARPVFDPALGRVVTRLLMEAETLYRRADAGISALPRDVRAAIRAARALYSEIGEVVRRAGGDSICARAVVGRSRKIALAFGAVSGLGLRGAPIDLAARGLPEAQFLVDAVAAHPQRSFPQTGPLAWSIDLFAALEERPRRII
jgi:phytoene synthase